MALFILRCFFLLVTAGIAASIVQMPGLRSASTLLPWGVFLGVLAVAVVVMCLDIVLPRKRIEMITCVYFGLVVGLFLTYILGIALRPLLEEAIFRDYRGPTQLIVGTILCYTCISLLIQTKDDFRFMIPYVEFVREVKGLKPYVLDTSVVIDGRIADLVETHLMDNQLIMPRFMLIELQGIADSSDKLRRTRGRRGLDVLNRLQNDKTIDLKIYEREHPEMAGQPNDMKLVLLAKLLEGKVVTGDYNLNKVAKLHQVEVINLNDVANALKPVFLPGEQIEIKIVKPGEESGQGVGYLDDGTMVVVEGGGGHVGKTVQIVVTSMLQTSAGRMIFGKAATAKSAG